MAFEGFSEETLRFFLDLRFHNEKAWFDAHKDIYLESVKAPMDALAEDLQPLMEELDPRLDLRTRRVVSRIYRDARIARGVPYRDHMWLSYKPMGKSNSQAFTYYVWLTPDEWGYGAGLYAYDPDVVGPFRERLVRHGEDFLEALRHPGMEAFEAYGRSPRRAPKLDLPEAIASWYNKKNFGFDHTRPIGPEVFSAAMADEIRKGFMALYPAYCFITGLDMPQQVY